MKIAESLRDHHSTWRRMFGVNPSIAETKAGVLKPFDLDAVNEGLDKMKIEYANKAHITAQLDRQLEVREEGGVKKVDVTIRVNEGEPYTVRRINIEGNTLTKDKVVRRALLVREGEPFRAALLQESFTSVGQLGFFSIEGQDPKIDIVQDQPMVDITLNGKEAGTNEVMFSAGYGSVSGATIGASYSTRNLGGNGETLSVGYTVGSSVKSATVSFTEPFVFDKPYSISASVHDTTTDYKASKVGEDNAYTQKSRGFDMGVGMRLSNFFPDSVKAYFTTYRIGYSLSRSSYSGGKNYLYRDIGSLVTSSINQSLTYDTTDNPFKPTRGTKASIGLQYAPSTLGTTRPFTKTSIDVSQFFTLGGRHTFGANASFGYIKNHSPLGIPLFEYYRPGGESSVRGYDYGQIGSIYVDNNNNSVCVGGIKQLTLNLEYQFKINDEVRAVLFWDAGNAWGPGEKMFNHDLVRYENRETGVDTLYYNPKMLESVGIELRLFMPISPAPIRFIWAKKLNPYPWDTSGETNFQFSIGTTF